MVTAVVSKGEAVSISGFAKFVKVDRPARMGRNPQTQQPVRIKASKKARITPLKGFKDAVVKTSLAPKLERGVWPPGTARPRRRAATKTTAAKTTAKKAPAKSAAKKTTPQEDDGQEGPRPQDRVARKARRQAARGQEGAGQEGAGPQVGGPQGARTPLTAPSAMPAAPSAFSGTGTRPPGSTGGRSARPSAGAPHEKIRTNPYTPRAVSGVLGAVLAVSVVT